MPNNIVKLGDCKTSKNQTGKPKKGPGLQSKAVAGNFLN